MPRQIPETQSPFPRKFSELFNSSTPSSSSFGSFESSSGLSSPFGSELGSAETETETGSDDEDFMAELTRQMADYMLGDDEEKHTEEDEEDEEEINRGVDLVTEPATSARICPDQPSSNEMKRPIQVYELKNQPVPKKQSFPTKVKVEHQKVQNCLKGTKRGSGLSGAGRDPVVSPQIGSGIQTAFFGGSGTRSGSSGTGVFLPRPRVTDNPVKPKRNSGCTRVLIPARVLQALQQHFTQMDAASQSNGSDATHESGSVWNQTRPPTNYEELQLPQEWTY